MSRLVLSFIGLYFAAIADSQKLKWVPRGVFKVILASADKQNPYKNSKPQGRNLTVPAAAQSQPKPSATKQEQKKPQLAAPQPAVAAPVVETPKSQAKVEIKEEPSYEPVKVEAPRERNQEKIMPAMQIVSEETGIALDDLTDNCAFTDIGVDSLLSMVIASRFREELGLDLDLEFSIFLDLPTVKHLKDFLDPPLSDAGSSSTALTARNYAEPPSAELMVPQLPTVVAPERPSEAPTELSAVEQSSQQLAQPSATYVESSTASTELVTSALNVISEESGVAVEDLTDSCTFSAIGVDSLLSMVIASRFREELGLDLDLEFSIFLDLPTVADLKRFLAGGSDNKATPEREPEASSSSSYSSGVSTPDKNGGGKDVISSDTSETPTPPSEQEPEIGSCRPATSVILQGFPKTSQKTLFLLPDGGGSSSSYVPLPRLGIDAAIIGLNCPYARDPWAMKCHYEDLMNSYMTEIRRRQSHGPYYLGGWSSGGIMSFMIAERFIKQGEEVHGLIIIDSPVPRVMDRLPAKMYEFCDSIGLFGYAMGQNATSIPDYVIPHFNATADALQGYSAKPIPEEHRIPKVAITWACESVLDEKNGPPAELKNHKGIHFLLERCEDFGSRGWETLLPGSDFVFDKVQGNHFTMMVSQI